MTDELTRLKGRLQIQHDEAVQNTGKLEIWASEARLILSLLDKLQVAEGFLKPDGLKGDLVRRLRKTQYSWPRVSHDLEVFEQDRDTILPQEAATEIERLRAKLETARNEALEEAMRIVRREQLEAPNNMDNYAVSRIDAAISYLKSNPMT